MRVAVTGGPPLSGALSLYPFGIKERPNGASLAMYPLVDFALQAHGYVSKGRSFLSDAPFRFQTQSYVKKGRRLLSEAPFGRFPEALVRYRRPSVAWGTVALPFRA